MLQRCNAVGVGGLAVKSWIAFAESDRHQPAPAGPDVENRPTKKLMWGLPLAPKVMARYALRSTPYSGSASLSHQQGPCPHLIAAVILSKGTLPFCLRQTDFLPQLHLHGKEFSAVHQDGLEGR